MDLVFTVFTFAKTLQLTGEVVPQEPYCALYSEQSRRLLKFIINLMDKPRCGLCVALWGMGRPLCCDEGRQAGDRELQLA